ncbi:MAG TPA: glycosyltransferase family 39 protein [Bacteroidales bacterium]|nr:glycosyltransferase family 39 protein [Bacteroidales bacterium]HRX97438.1 glycosyltransferase family 39 protein [Bacteroidales bacterium]
MQLKNSSSSPLLFFIFALGLSLPAFFINLGQLPFIDDESIRAMVAFEMLQKNDFITPTVGGEIYLKKPPLFNWLVAGSFNVFNSYGEFPVRIPMILSLYLLTIAIFYYFKKEMTTELGIITALMFLTTGRIIMYESLYGLIDLTFSLLTFLFFMMIYRAFNEGKLLKLFILAYVLTAISFLLKGLPSIVFLGISLLVLFISHRKFKMLFFWQHYVGIALFVIIVGSYYVTYFMQNEVPLNDMVSVMFGETTRRTAIRFGFWNTVLHLFAFPFEMIFHFLPWTLLTLVLFTKGTIKKIKASPFLTYLSLILFFNSIVYWTSPEVYPRYILMLVPLYFGIITYFYLEKKKENHRFVKFIEVAFGILITLAAVGAIALFFIEIPGIKHLILITSGLLVTLGIAAFFYWKQLQNRIYWLVIALLIMRIGFDLIAIPNRMYESDAVKGKETTIAIAEKSMGSPLYFWWNPEREVTSYYGKRLTTYWLLYYLSITRDEIIYTISERKPDAYYISPLWMVKNENVEIIEEFQPTGHESPLVLFRFKEPI